MVTMTDLGEKNFLKTLLPDLKVSPVFMNGFGHDASILDIGLEQLLACKIDRAPFPVAIKREIGDYKTWGRLAVVANVSDLLAVGATPKAMMLSLVVPGCFDAENAREIVLGCQEACITHDIAFVGGDTKEGPVSQVIGAAWGTVERGTAYGRCAARPGDYLFIAGQIGAFSGAMALMDTNASSEEIPQSWVDALANPIARINEGSYMRQSRKVAGACDLSDGLTEAIRIFCADGAGITISEASLPMHSLAEDASLKTGVPLWKFALGVGDWAIACIIREEDRDSFKEEMPSGIELFEVGRFDDSGQSLIQDQTGRNQELPPLINEHFRQRAEDDASYLQELLQPN
jgi:thiamine-monophosphate kinase